jgi:hypothetical protein
MVFHLSSIVFCVVGRGGWCARVRHVGLARKDPARREPQDFDLESQVQLHTVLPTSNSWSHTIKQKREKTALILVYVPQHEIAIARFKAR